MKSNHESYINLISSRFDFFFLSCMSSADRKKRINIRFNIKYKIDVIEAHETILFLFFYSYFLRLMKRFWVCTEG